MPDRCRSCWRWSAARCRASPTGRPSWLPEKKIRTLLQIAPTRLAALPEVPTALEFAKTEEQREVLQLLMEMKDVGRPFFMAPEVPEARFAAIETAFMALLKDKEFLAEAAQQKRDIEPVSGPEMQAMLKRAYALPPP